MMAKPRIATVWLDGCSGCHMSLLDIDERLLEIAGKIELVSSPLVDAKEFPDNVDLTLVEGAIASKEDVETIRRIRCKTRLLVALGDCAVTGGVPAMRNNFVLEDVLRRGYTENATANQGAPDHEVPELEPKVIPLHESVTVDVFVPGCPPPADLIDFVLSEVLAGRVPDLATRGRFGN
ncbi:MAG: oxidoreductase [Terracidiphilus sp.]|jgi:NAD-reducing hydrogenase small subunit